MLHDIFRGPDLFFYHCAYIIDVVFVNFVVLLVWANQQKQLEEDAYTNIYTIMHKYHFTQTVFLPQNHHPMELLTIRTLSTINKLYSVQI